MILLITDTDYGMIKDVKLLFSLCEPDWQVLICCSAQQCLAAVSHNPDLYIIGADLPDMTGFNLIEKIREDSDTPIIAVSNSNDEAMLVKALDSGANDYIVKPFNKQLFIARLKAAIRRYRWDKDAIESKLDNGQEFSDLSNLNVPVKSKKRTKINKKGVLKYAR
jgi:two-component system KDP operon response regulator KdpE